MLTITVICPERAMNHPPMTAQTGPAVIPLSNPLPSRLWRALGDALAAWRARRTAHAAVETLGRLDAHTLRDIGMCSDVIAAVREHQRQDAARWLGHGGGAY